jgi:hypothetical protein
MIPRDATHLVRGYNHQGKLLVETWHRGDGSKDVEVQVWKSRRDSRGDVGRIEVVDLSTHKTEVVP